MIVTRNDVVVNKEEGPTPQNVKVGDAQFLMDEVQLMMKNMLDQQRRKIKDLLTQELANARDGEAMTNGLIVIG